MKTSIVLGMGFGDEGKGLTTSYLASQSQNPIVVRFNGGHQAGHTVVNGERRHVFSSFGSATMQGVPTYWSEHCTFYPSAARLEFYDLVNLGLCPEIYIHPLAPVTLPLDIHSNRQHESENRHGSVGVGFGTTIKRHEAFYKLHYQDLFHYQVMKAKIANISEYYDKQGLLYPNWKESIELWWEDVSILMKEKAITKQIPKLRRYDHIIFEGAQGILLDMDHGFFPNVTRSNTTSKNALEIIAREVLLPPQIYYITRAYQTRHGNGFMSNEGLAIDLTNNQSETNQQDDWQGHFRTGVLDIDMLNYAIDCDMQYSGSSVKNIMITCLDQVAQRIPYTVDRQLKEGSIDDIIGELNCNFADILLSSSPASDNCIRQHSYHVKLGNLT